MQTLVCWPVFLSNNMEILFANVIVLSLKHMKNSSDLFIMLKASVVDVVKHTGMNVHVVLTIE